MGTVVKQQNRGHYFVNQKMQSLLTMIVMMVLVTSTITRIEKSSPIGKFLLVETEPLDESGEGSGDYYGEIGDDYGEDYGVKCNINGIDAGGSIRHVCVQTGGSGGDSKPESTTTEKTPQANCEPGTKNCQIILKD